MHEAYIWHYDIGCQYVYKSTELFYSSLVSINFEFGSNVCLQQDLLPRTMTEIFHDLIKLN